MKRSLRFSGLLVGTCVSLPALAQTSPPDKEEAKQTISLGLAPGTPQVGALPGGLTPAYGLKAADEKDWRFDFHGFLTMPLRAGFNTRAGAVTTEQHKSVLHAPPVVPDYRGAFASTGVVPQPFVQLNFSYGNSVVTGNVSVLARNAVTAEAFFNPPEESGISDAFLNFRLPNLAKNTHFEVNVGAFTNRYGTMGEYDEGRYGSPVVMRTNGVGENIVAKFAFGKLSLSLEQGIQGQLDKAPNGLLPAGWNGFADPNVGTGFVNHVHAGLGYLGVATLGLHYATAWTQDDRASQSTVPDGSIGILGADLRLSLEHFGHLYFGAVRTKAENSRSVGRIVEVLNAPGGPGLMREYLGPNSGGTGELFTIALQYDLSLGYLLRYPFAFRGDGPDVVVSLFGIETHVSSKEVAFDNLTKRKAGVEASYAMLPWLASSIRVDRVVPNANDGDQSFSIVSPRLIFRTGWQAHDQVVLQYSHWFYGGQDGKGDVRSGYPAVNDATIFPDGDVVSLSASMWW
jgi:hypothetical protein